VETFENTVTIHSPVEDVFAFLADFENVPSWNDAIEETMKTSAGPVGLGTSYRQTRSIPTRSEESFEVTTFDPPHRLGIEGRIGQFHARLGYVLEPMGAGTRVTNTVELQPQSAVSKLLAPLAVSRIKSAVASNLDQLKVILEGGRPAPG
jgi:uncharacterized protein YndB with AHSA1/START domain